MKSLSLRRRGWMNYLIGIEREGFRIDFNGIMSAMPHPKEFGDKLENPLIGTDFGEAMLELRTHPHPDPERCYKELLRVTSGALGILYEQGEVLWPYTMPPQMPEDADFYYNSYPGRPDLEEHERLIAGVYGIRRNCLSGVHVNFSVSNEALEEIRKIYPSIPGDKDDAYMRCARQVLRHEAALRHFFDASPTDYEGRIAGENSFRNGPLGFRNINAEKLDYSNKTAYLKSLDQTAPYERRSAIRIKSCDKENFDEGIAQHGIERFEFRLCDIDPFDICGISINEMKLALAVLFMCMIMDEIPDAPADILLKCEEVNRKLHLGLESGIMYYMEKEKTGMTKCEAVRKLITESGYAGLMELAFQYGKTAAEKRKKQFEKSK
jgi:glutamate--cysteine ligase